MNNLKKELDDISNIDESIKDTLINIFNSWSICKNNHQYIENIENTSLTFDSDIGELNLFKKSLFIENCNNLDIIVYNKFNNIILLNSNNININILGGLITGINIIHCTNINLIIKTIQIPNVNFEFANNCIITLDNIHIISDYLRINTNFCVNIIINIDYNNIYKSYITNKSLFSKLNYFIIDSNMQFYDYLD